MNGDLKIILEDAQERIELLLERERELTDDLADTLDRYWRRINEAPTVYSDDDSDVKAVLARYRETRQQ